MKITGEHAFASPRQKVWDALQDPQMLANALPGVKRLEVIGPDAYAITVSVGVGSVRGTYDGTFVLADKQEGEACTVRANASGGPGSVEAAARMQLRDGANGGTALSYEADANVTGPLAGVGQRLIGGAARRTTKEFLDALDQLITAPPTVAVAEAEPVPAAATQEAGAPAAAGRVFAPTPSPAAARAGVDPVVVAVSALAGFLLALIGVAFGRRTARH
jgi:carbon monoxide dehydrogenase subunit G